MTTLHDQAKLAAAWLLEQFNRSEFMPVDSNIIKWNQHHQYISRVGCNRWVINTSFLTDAELIAEAEILGWKMEGKV